MSKAYRIVSDDGVAEEQFRRWHDLLVSIADQQSKNEYAIGALGFKFALRETRRPVPDCDLTWSIDAPGRTVQINPADSAGDANVLSAIGEDREAPGSYAVLRQGRLQPNQDTSRTITGGEFRYAFQKLPVSTTGSFGAKGREWYLVCDLSDDADEVAQQTGDFVERCATVRTKFRDD